MTPLKLRENHCHRPSARVESPNNQVQAPGVLSRSHRSNLLSRSIGVVRAHPSCIRRCVLPGGLGCPIRFFCPECHKPLSIGSRMAGTRIVCPLCKDRVVVPGESTYQEPPSLETPVALDDQDLEPAVARSIPVALPTGQSSRRPPAKNVSASVPERLPFVPPLSRRHRLLDPAIGAVVLLAVFVNPLTVALIASRGEQSGSEQCRPRPSSLRDRRRPWHRSSTLQRSKRRGRSRRLPLSRCRSSTVIPLWRRRSLRHCCRPWSKRSRVRRRRSE